MIITGDDIAGISNLKEYLNHQFEMKDLDPLNIFLVLRSPLPLMDIISLRPSMLQTYFLELA